MARPGSCGRAAPRSSRPPRPRPRSTATPVYIHLDLDVLDGELIPAEFPAPGGLSLPELADVLAGVAASSEVLGIEITCFPAPDAVPDGEALAASVSDAVAGLL